MSAETFVILAHRWGYLNDHYYIAGTADSLEAGKIIADNEHDRRGGKYGVAVYRSGEVVYYAPSSFGETTPFQNQRICAFEQIGAMCAVAVEHDFKLPGRREIKRLLASS